ncbi:MAG: indole-3-glycerol phosphate synthase TrpC [Propionibacteriaceae bacterium]|jgi:indole-3-glycerol phosphate synthase/phosphoribosylanthranilate isomerase|nr:indole-3-glycerol phosphate synthase TrpC [Propionibacteriaceae bacterium]
MTILDQLAAEARERVAAAKAKQPSFQDYPKQVLPFLRPGVGLQFICEVKRASPSKGLIAREFPYVDIAVDYEVGGATAISVLTEPNHFLGADKYLRDIARRVHIPVLRKDFVVDAYQIYQARWLGASAVLLIVSILSPAQLAEYIQVTESLGMAALVEAHDAAEIEVALAAGAKIIGVNNRDLKDFSVDTSNAAALRALVPPNVVFVSESGVRGPEDIPAIVASGADAVLVGEALMRAPHRELRLRKMIKAAQGRYVKMPELKVCGITRVEDARALNAVCPSYAGFIFVPSSRRRVDLGLALEMREVLDRRTTTVGVFADAPIPEVAQVVASGAVSVVQLHGNEDATYIAQLRQAIPALVVIKAVPVDSAARIVEYAQRGADYLLLDNVRGGSGETFDWNLIEQAKQLAAAQGVTIPPYFLAGGLHPENIKAAAALQPYALDVNSGVETDGYKDPGKLRWLKEYGGNVE